MRTLHTDLQERLGSAMHALALIEQQSSTLPETKTAQTFLKNCRRLVDDLERGFSLLQQASSEHANLREQVETASTRAGVLFELSPVPCVVVHETGMIADANTAATRLLNTSSRYLQEKSFELFLGSDRDDFLGWLRAVARGKASERRRALLRPREQRPKQVLVVGTPEVQGRVALVLVSGEESVAASPDTASVMPQMTAS